MVREDKMQTDREREREREAGRVSREESKESMSSVRGGMIREVRRQEIMRASGRDV